MRIRPPYTRRYRYSRPLLSVVRDPVGGWPARPKPAGGHWLAPENRASNVHTLAQVRSALRATPETVGFALRLFWSDLEGAQGDYSAGFATVDSWLAMAAEEGRKMILIIVDKTYRDDYRNPLPSYLAAYAVENNDALSNNKWAIVGQRWETVTYIPRLVALMNAYQQRYNGRTAWEGIRYPDEQAMSLANKSAQANSTIANGQSNPQGGAPWYNTPTDTPPGHNDRGSYQANSQNYSPCGTGDADATRPTINGVQYTSTLYKNALISLIQQTEATRPNSWFYLSLNYLYGSTNSVGNKDICDAVYNGGNKLRVVIGNNNASYNSASQISNSYNQVFPYAHSLGLPLWVSVEQMDYSLPENLNYIFDWFTKPLGAGGNPYGWGQSMKAIQWVMYESGTYKWSTDGDAVAAANPTFNA